MNFDKSNVELISIKETGKNRQVTAMLHVIEYFMLSRSRSLNGNRNNTVE